jgi:7-keto-8-aminopelargonate synthetase-like enzyme
VIERLRAAPAARGATVGNPAGAAMAAAAMRLIRREPGRLDRLRSNSALLKKGLEGLGLAPRPSASPVATFVHGCASDMRALTDGLWADGIYVILSSYIGAGAEGAVRIAAFADHHPDDFARLMAALARRLDLERPQSFREPAGQQQ